LIIKTLYLRKKLRLEHTSFHLHPDQMNNVMSTFNWMGDPEQADMLSTVLSWRIENDNWPTSSNLIETLVKILTLTRCQDLARPYASRVSNESVELGGKRILVRNLANHSKKPLQARAYSV
jgi:hypothetical protein